MPNGFQVLQVRKALPAARSRASSNCHLQQLVVVGPRSGCNSVSTRSTRLSCACIPLPTCAYKSRKRYELSLPRPAHRGNMTACYSACTWCCSLEPFQGPSGSSAAGRGRTRSNRGTVAVLGPVRRQSNRLQSQQIGTVQEHYEPCQALKIG